MGRDTKRRSARIHAQQPRPSDRTGRGKVLVQAFLGLLLDAGLRLSEAMGLTRAKPQEADRQGSGIPTIGTLFDWYDKAILQGQALHTQRTYRATFHAVLKHFGRDARPTKGELLRWLTERVERERIKPSTANAIRAQLHAVYTRARDEKWPLLLNAAALSRFRQAERRAMPRDRLNGERVLSRYTNTTQEYLAQVRRPVKRRGKRRKGGL